MAPGSTANVISALASILFPGLGQLVQGRVLAALFFLILGGVIWGIFLLLGLITFGVLTPGGFLGHILAAWNCAVWRPRQP